MCYCRRRLFPGTGFGRKYFFYTRAGALQIDPNSGNLTDANGYTVLGFRDPLGKAPGSNKIHLDIPSQQAAKAVKTETINGIRYTLTSEKATTDANVSVNFVVDDTCRTERTLW